MTSLLNVAATCQATRALGPGWRAAVWVQGCPLNCAGCLAPEWIPDRPARAVRPDQLAAELLGDPRVTGLTFSGGEPMAQAGLLAATALEARRHRELTLICFTGLRLERLRQDADPGVLALLAQIDVLIDGPYVATLNDGTGLRGSTNQRVHQLTDRLRDTAYDFVGRRRDAEVQLTGGAALLVGVPPLGLAAALDQASARFARSLRDGPLRDQPLITAPSTSSAGPLSRPVAASAPEGRS